MPITRSEFEASLFSDISRDEFFAEYWDKRPYVFRDKGRARFKKFFGSIDPRDLVRSWMSAAAGGGQVQCAIATYKEGRTADEQVDGAKQLESFDSGISGNYRLYGIDSLDDGVMRFRTCVSELVGLAVDVSSYGTGIFVHQGSAQGLELHSDQQPIFQINLCGRRAWRVTPEPADDWGDTVEPGPDGFIRFEHESGEERAIDIRNVELDEYVLEPGDIFYLPASHPHQTASLTDFSVGISYICRYHDSVDLLRRSMEAFGGRAWRKPFALFDEGPFAGVNRYVGIEELAKRVRAWADAVVSDPEILAATRNTFVPQRIEMAEVVEQRTERPKGTFCVPVNLPVFATARDPEGGWIRTLRMGTEELEFDTKQEARFAGFLHDGGCFSIDEIARATGMEEAEVEEFVEQLVEMEVLTCA